MANENERPTPIKIGGELEPQTVDHILGTAETIIDDAWDKSESQDSKRQSAINSYLQDEIEDIQAESWGELTPDTIPEYNSGHLITSGGVYTGITAAKTFTTGETVDATGIDPIPTSGSDNLVKSGGVANMYGSYTENPEYVYVQTDNEDKILYGVKTGGDFFFGAGVPSQIAEAITNETTRAAGVEATKVDKVEGKQLSQENYTTTEKTKLGALPTNEDLTTALNTKVDKEAEKSLIDSNYASAQSVVDNDEYLLVILDAEGRILFGIKTDGTFEDSQSSLRNYEEAIASMEKTVANGGKTKRTLNLLNTLPRGQFIKDGEVYVTTPFMSFHDDDTLDHQIPVSTVFGATPETRTIMVNAGGFASFLYPFMKSITERHKLGKKLVPNATTKGYDVVDESSPNPIKGSLVYSLSAEGQRIGLTGLYSDQDMFDGSLNFCGRMASKLHYRCGWDIMCHSMTARYISNSYWVNSFNDPLVSQIEAAATPGVQNNSSNSYIHCADTNIDYEYRLSNGHGEWHIVSDHYVRPYLAKSLAADAPLFFNPRYSESYQVEEWKKRAQIAGLPFIDCGISWGDSPCGKFLLERREFINNWFDDDRKSHPNKVPLESSGFERLNFYDADNNNKWSDARFIALKSAVDEAIANGWWLVVYNHAYDLRGRNYYEDGVDYGDRYCSTYPSEWTVPLKQEELETIDENNYWEVPPARLGISSWAEWYPCPGTIFDMNMNVIEYAIEKGMEFGSTAEGIRRYANLFNIGIKQSAVQKADNRLDSSEKDPRWFNYIIKGSNGAIKYNIK